MTWYAIKTLTGAQLPQREYVVEDTSGGKHYRIVASLDPKMSAIERSLTRAGIAFYMPCEHKVIRSRKKTATFTTRRFALLQGYVFTHDVYDYVTLKKIPGYGGTVGALGVPLEIPLHEMMRLRKIEAESFLKAERELAKIISAEHSAAAKAAAKALSKAKRVFAEGSRVSVLYGVGVGREATIAGWDTEGHLKALVDGLEAEGLMSMSFDTVRLVA